MTIMVIISGVPIFTVCNGSVGPQKCGVVGWGDGAVSFSEIVKQGPAVFIVGADGGWLNIFLFLIINFLSPFL